MKRFRKCLVATGIVLCVLGTAWLAFSPELPDVSILFSPLTRDALVDRYRNTPNIEGLSNWHICEIFGRPDNITPVERYDVFFFNPPRSYKKVYFYDAVDLAVYINADGIVVATGKPVRKIASFAHDP